MLDVSETRPLHQRGIARDLTCVRVWVRRLSGKEKEKQIIMLFCYWEKQAKQAKRAKRGSVYI